ncbi:MAG: hypothetical protein Q7I93_05660 [Syntrophales bacterium]|nr:hypothetical protein [Syntrophales bacterium]
MFQALLLTDVYEGTALFSVGAGSRLHYISLYGKPFGQLGANIAKAFGGGFFHAADKGVIVGIGNLADYVLSCDNFGDP